MTIKIIHIEDCFDSILVRLEGTVLSRGLNPMRSFDSILVRLEDSASECVRRWGFSFDSILVRLEVIRTEISGRVFITSFDSILVRLEVSITPLTRSDKQVSIPYWFD